MRRDKALHNPKPLPRQSFPVVRIGQEVYTQAFGYQWPGLQSDIAVHLNCARMGLKQADGGLGRTRHLFEAHNLLWPQYAATLHEWTVERFKAFNREKVVSLAGGASTGKSDDAARYGLLWWWENPADRAVIVCSTTVNALKKRIWSYIASCYHSTSCDMVGDISTPRGSAPPSMLYDKRDPKHGFHGIALKEGDKERTLRDLIGIHPAEALLVIVDEATDVPHILEDAISNWDSGSTGFQLILVGNSKSRFDPHGKFSEPILGWASVNPDVDIEWRTKWGVCLYFDCYRSPALHSPDKAKLQFLVNDKTIKNMADKFGENDPRFWRFARGFWPPDDIGRYVITYSDIVAHGARDRAEWNGTWQIKLAGLDPAFTSDGDECILQFATLGPTKSGLLCLDFGGEENVISLKLDSRSKEPINYQILRLTKKECLARGVKPEHVGVDTWGFGTGAGDIFEKEWSADIHRIISIGGASEEYVDSDMSNQSYELYDRKATEMAFSFRTFLRANQIKGLDDLSVEELCSRAWDWKGRKMAIESKRDYKKRMGKEDGPEGSPDRSDAKHIVLEVAKTLGFYPGKADSLGDENKSSWFEDYETYMGRANPGQEVEDRELSWNAENIMESSLFGDE